MCGLWFIFSWYCRAELTSLRFYLVFLICFMQLFIELGISVLIYVIISHVHTIRNWHNMAWVTFCVYLSRIVTLDCRERTPRGLLYYRYCLLTVLLHKLAMQWLKWLIASLWVSRPWFDPRTVHVGFMVDILAQGQVSICLVWLYVFSIFPSK